MINTLADLADHTLAQLEWPQVLEQVVKYCRSIYGINAWRQQPFFPRPEPAAQHLQQVIALVQHLNRHGWPDVEENTVDLSTVLVRLQKGGTLSFVELVALRQLLATIRRWLQALRDDPQTLSVYEDIAAGLDAAPLALRRKINQLVTETGEWSAQAHPELGRLLHQQKSLKQAAENHIQALLQQPDIVAQLQSTRVLIREGHLALAVKAVHKNHFPGELLSSSATGATVFMTPKALVSLNKKLLDVENDLALMLERLLQEASEACVAVLPELQTALEAFGMLDRRLAGASWAKALQAEAPQLLEEKGQCRLINVRHPLIEQPVPNTVRLGNPDKTLVITGPNTGGKTVLLKTVGLTVLLMRCGLPLPADKSTALSWFDHVYADIGDEQSLAQNLSTFSAHLVKLRLLTQPDVNLASSLVLLDEISAGTDPTEGGALAQAVLETLYQSGALCIVTTHLGSLKLFANDTTGFCNGSVGFDADTLSPTYQLIQGVPGTSHALRIAERLGVNPSVITAARSRMNQGERDTSALLEQMASQQARIQEELHKAQSYRQEAQTEFERLNDLRHKLEQERKQLLHQLKTQIRSQTQDIQDQLKRLRKRVNANLEQPNPQQMAKLAEQINRVSDRTANVFNRADRPLAKLPKRRSLQTVSVGQEVYCKKLNMNMTVVSVQGDKIQVSAGLVKSFVHLKDLEPRQTQQSKQTRAYEAKTTQSAVPATIADDDTKAFVDLLSCDVRGQSADEAVHQLSQFLDQAILAGFETVSVIHGLGTGALKQAIREQLRQHPLVKEFYPAQAVEGGDGKTMIKLV